MLRGFKKLLLVSTVLAVLIVLIAPQIDLETPALRALIRLLSIMLGLSWLGFALTLLLGMATPGKAANDATSPPDLVVSPLTARRC